MSFDRKQASEWAKDMVHCPTLGERGHYLNLAHQFIELEAELSEARDMFMVCELARDSLRNELADARAVFVHITSEEFPKPLCCVRAIQGQGTNVALHFDELARAYLSRYPEVKP
jgi:hypothetical protein